MTEPGGKMGADGGVIVVDYDPEWPRTFGRLRDTLASALGDITPRIEHVGSTAVPGLAAKPIIDLDVIVASDEDVASAIDRLRPIGYLHVGDQGVPGREAFTAPDGAPAHHLYVLAAGQGELGRHLRFRDHLRAHREVADAYAALKKALARTFAHDRDAYTEAKSGFVEQALAAAAVEAREKPEA